MKDAEGQDELFIALDVGTSGVKAGLYTARGRCRRRCQTPLGTLTPRPGRSELDLGLVWRSVVGSVRRLLAPSPGRHRIAGIGLSVTSPTVVVVGADGTPLSNGLTYADARALPRLRRVVLEELEAALVEEAGKLKVGHGLEEETVMGPLSSRDQLERTR